MPSPLEQIQLIPNAINTIDVLTTTKPLDVYMETYIPEEPDPEDPLSGYSGIIYNDGVLDVTQEDPDALNELTFHFRDDVDKTLTIPSTPLPIASDTTLGGIKVGANLTIDPETGVLDATGGGGTEYAAGDGIQIDEGTSVIDTTTIQWQQGKINDTDGTEAISDVEPYLDCEMFEITSHTSMVTLSGTYANNIMLLWKPYYYDENENYILTVNNWSTYADGVQIPINAKYVRFVLTQDETTTLDPNDLAHVEIEYPLEVGKEVITNTGVIDVQVRDRKLIIIKHDHIEEIPIPDPPLATTTTPGIVAAGATTGTWNHTSYSTTLQSSSLTANRTATLPNATGTIPLITEKYNSPSSTSTGYNLTFATSFKLLMITAKPSSSLFGETTVIVPAPTAAGTTKTYVNWPGHVAEASSQPTRSLSGYVRIQYTNNDTCTIDCVLADYYLQADSSVSSGSTSGFKVYITRVIGISY